MIRSQQRRDSRLRQLHGDKLKFTPADRAFERGEINDAEVETLMRYATALGGKLRLLVDFGDDLFQIA